MRRIRAIWSSAIETTSSQRRSGGGGSGSPSTMLRYIYRGRRREISDCATPGATLSTSPAARYLVAAILITVFPQLVDADTDHLIPVDKRWEPKYREILDSRLAVTRFDCGRVLIRPAFTGESSLAVHCEPADASAHPRCFVTYIKSEDNLWQRTDAAHQPGAARSVRVHRYDKAISADTADLLKRVWFKMLRNTRPEAFSKEGEITLDATNTEFSIEQANGSPLYGQVNFRLRTVGKRVGAFVHLCEVLAEYCQADRNVRSEIEQRIRQVATVLSRD